MELYKCYSWNIGGKAKVVQVVRDRQDHPFKQQLSWCVFKVDICQFPEYDAFNSEYPITGMCFHYPLLLQSVTKTVLFPPKIKTGKRKEIFLKLYRKLKLNLKMRPELVEMPLFTESDKHWGCGKPPRFNHSVTWEQQIYVFISQHSVESE